MKRQPSGDLLKHAPRLTLIWTRGLQDWAVDAPVLSGSAAASWDLLHIPCVEIRTLPLVLPQGTPDYVVITSANAAKRAADNPAFKQSMLAAKQVLTHGAKTAKALQALGINATLVSSASTAADLCTWLGQNLQKPAHIWLPVAAEPAFDMAAGLAALGFATSVLPCYETLAEARQANREPFSEALVAQLQQELTGVICFASPSAVAGFARVFAPRSHALGRSLHACVIGPTTEAAAVAYFERVTVAAEASIEALVAKALSLLS